MIISIVIAKLTLFLLRLFKRGATTLPGKIALKIKPDILTKLSCGVKIICITGTNGKTTTCALIEHALKSNGLSYLINKSGANMITGVTTAFIENCTILGKCKKEYAILECDENSLPLISSYINAEVLAVTNLFRDQLDRYGEINTTFQKIKLSAENLGGAALVINADCPLTNSLSLGANNRVFTFGVNADYPVSAPSDVRHCPVCSSELRYKSHVYAQLGDYYCPRCEYRRKTPDYYAESISSSELGSVFIFNRRGEKQLCSTSLGGIYNVYNFCTAAAVLDVLGIEKTDCLCTFSGAFGRMERFKNGDKTVLLLLVKNPVGLTGCIRYVCKIKGELNIAFALNDNDADGRDVSWIWDSDFSPIKTKCPRVYTAGTRSLDMALRLKYDGIDVKSENIIDGEDYARLVETAKNCKCDLVIFSTYTAMMKMRHGFIEAFGGKEFWK